MRKLISSGSPYEARYGYSRAVVDGDYVFVSGTTGYDYASMVMPESVEEQTRNIWATIEWALMQAGSSLANVVRAQYFVTRETDPTVVLAICGDVLRDIRPAAGIYIVAGLLKPEMKIEIEVTARVIPASSNLAGQSDLVIAR